MSKSGGTSENITSTVELGGDGSFVNVNAELEPVTVNANLAVTQPIVTQYVTRRRHELSSMGIRVDRASLWRQLELTGQLDFLRYPYHQAILNGEIPLSVGGGIGQLRTLMLLLRKAHLGEVSVTVWPKVLKDMCVVRNIHVLE